MSVLLNRVRQAISSPTGTGGPLVLSASAYSNAYQTIAGAGGVDQSELCYIIEEGNDWEIQRGLWTLSSNQLARNTPILSSIAGVSGTTKLTLAGAAFVRVVADAEEFSYLRGTRAITAATDTIAHAHNSVLTIYNRATAIATALAAPSGNSFKGGWVSYYKNIGVGAVTITVTGATLASDGVSTTVVTLAQYESMVLFSDGTNYHALISRQPLYIASLGLSSTQQVNAANNILAASGAAVQSLTAAQQAILLANAGVIGNQGLCAKNGSNLELQRANGRYIFINGRYELIPSSAPTLAAPATSGTLYYIYAYMSGATLTLEASTTVYAVDSTYGHKIKNGDATRTLIGMARTVSSAWVDSATQRFVRSLFNEISKPALAQNGNNALLSTNTRSEIDSTKRLEFLLWAGEKFVATISSVSIFTVTNPNQADFDIGFDGTAAECPVRQYTTANNISQGPATAVIKDGLAEGYHYATGTLTYVSGATNSQVSASNVWLRGHVQ